MASGLVLPGDKLSTEEEFVPKEGTFSEGGVIYSYVFGEQSVRDGGVYITPKGKDLKTFKPGMYALGEITDDLRTVMFVKLSNIQKDNTVFIALKSGKYVMPKPQFGDRRGGFRGREERGDRSRERPKPEKPFKTGDIIVARIIGEDNDTYSLGVNAPECGVVYSECDLCGGFMHYNKESRNLVCSECKNREQKKVSVLYNNFMEIEKLFRSVDDNAVI